MQVGLLSGVNGSAYLMIFRPVLVSFLLGAPPAFLQATARPAPSAPRKVIAIHVSWASESQLQKDVDAGHQPWRLEAIPVALSAVAAYEEVQPDKGLCVMKRDTGREAIVKVRGRCVYLVRLRRLVKPRGIWTAVQITRS